jgi:hypothetical protein
MRAARLLHGLPALLGAVHAPVVVMSSAAKRVTLTLHACGGPTP